MFQQGWVGLTSIQTVLQQDFPRAKFLPLPESKRKQLFAENEPVEIRNKVIFIHFNHTNPVLQENSTERKKLEYLGFRIAKEKAMHWA